MSAFRHSIRQQTLDIEVDSEALALALQPRIGDVNRQRFVPVIARVLDEFAVPGRQVRIARLDVDLGDLPLDDFERAAEAALDAALRRAVEAALREAVDNPSAENWARPEAASRLAMIEHYLLRGTLPFSAGAEEFSAEALLLELAASDRAGLAATIGRLARDRLALERLVLQLDAASLEALLRVFAPEHAALILAYMLDLRQIHRVAPLITLADDAFARLLWVLALSYVLCDPGSQFNRKSFVRDLLEGMAESEGLDYLDLVETLRRGLHATQQRHALASSLPAVVAELLRDLSLPTAPGDEPAVAASRREWLEHYLLHGSLPSSEWPGAAPSLDQLVQDLLEHDPVGFAEVVRRHGRQEPVLERMVDRLGDRVLRRILALLDAEHAALVIAYMVDLRELHRADALVRLSDDRFARLLWILVLSYMLREAGTQFNRRSFVRALLEGMAEREALDYTELAKALRRGLQQTGMHLPSASSLLAVIREFVGDLAMPTGATGADRAGGPGGDALAWLEQYLATGQMPARLPAGLDPLFRLAVAQDAAAVGLLIRRLGRGSDAGRAAAVRRLLPDVEPGELLALMEPAHRTAIEELIEGAADAASRAGGAADGARARAWAAALDYAASRPAGAFDIGAMARRIATAGASRTGRSPPDRTADSAMSPPRRDEVSDVRSAVASYDRVAQLRYYLRHGMLPWAALVADAGLTVESTLASLIELSPLQLRALFAGGADERLLQRALRQLPDDRIVELLTRLLPQALRSDARFRAALATALDQASDRRALSARVIAAVLDGAPIDLEPAAESRALPAPEPDLAASPEQWQAAEIKSLLVSRLRFGADFRPGGPDSGRLLEALAARYGSDPRWFLQAVADAPDLSRALVRQVPPALLHAVLDAIHPAETAVLQAIIDALGPLPLRPQPDEQRHEIFARAVLHLARGPAANVLAEVLRRWFGAPLPDEVRRLLSRHIAAWRVSGALPAAAVSALEAAMARIGRSEAVSDHDGEAVPAGVPPALQQEVFAWLREEPAGVADGADGHGAGNLPDDTLLYALHRMIDADRDKVADFVRRHAAEPRRRERWAETLPDSALARIGDLLDARRHRALLATGEILLAAWREAAPPGRRPDRALLWSVLLAFLVAHRGVDPSPGRLVAAFIARTAGTEPLLAARLLDHVGRLAQAAGHAGLLAVLERDRPRLLGDAGAPARAATKGREQERRTADDDRRRIRAADRGRTAFSLLSDEDAPDRGPIYIANAGLVLTAAFLPHLFQTLDMLARDDAGRQRLRDADAVSRAVHLLQYLVDGRTGAPEPLLVLNKILCGVPVQAPVARAIDPTEAERMQCESLLRSMIAHWTIIASTSIAGLRETFLKREGKLQRTDEGWKLRVQRKTVDVLVDQVPWSISVIYQPWMPEPIHVTW